MKNVVCATVLAVVTVFAAACAEQPSQPAVQSLAASGNCSDGTDCCQSNCDDGCPVGSAALAACAYSTGSGG